jgi:DNA-binding transcriptional ArsR family regulator
MLKPSTFQLDRASEMLKALAHPIVELISEKTVCTVSQIQEALQLEQAVVSQQLSILRSRGILVYEREGKNCSYSLKYACLSNILDCLKSCKS